MIQVNAIGDACPLPVIKTMHALQELGGAGTVEVLVDNDIAVQNLTRLAESKGCAIESDKCSDARASPAMVRRRSTICASSRSWAWRSSPAALA